MTQCVCIFLFKIYLKFACHPKNKALNGILVCEANNILFVWVTLFDANFKYILKKIIQTHCVIFCTKYILAKFIIIISTKNKALNGILTI